MLKKKFRLKSRPLFRHTLNSRRICINELFVLYGLEKRSNKPETGLPRFGFVVSKKVHKRANRRNLVKRRLREAVRTELLPQCGEQLAAYRAIVIIARAGLLTARYADIGPRLLRCFGKAASPATKN